jgi:D-glycero-alpha-D-manno-heptose-7-phosphate kinase
MSHYGISIRELLEKSPIQGSAPCRIDSGGTWDIKAMALPFEGLNPITVNIALDLRTFVSLLPFKSGWIKVSSDTYPYQESYPLIEAPFGSRFGLFLAIAAYFMMHGVEISIHSSSPVNAGLGGSSTAAVATIKAFSMARALLNQGEIERRNILHLAYQLEDGVCGGGCGMQDQGAAVFGGVHAWSWNYSREGSVFERETIVEHTGYEGMSRRMLVAYSGRRHRSIRINRRWIKEFLCGGTRFGWIEANRMVHRLASHIREGRWEEAAGALRDEVAIRRKITPEAFTTVIDLLIRGSEDMGCGARFAGAGGGGSVWAIGETDAITRLRGVWEDILKTTRNGRILDCRIDPDGVRAEGRQEDLSLL